MGNNQAFTTFEATVIHIYDSGALTPDLLNRLGERYRGTDIDRGGQLDVLAQDGLGIDQIIIKTFQVDVGLPSPEDVCEEDAFHRAVSQITGGRWGWF